MGLKIPPSSRTQEAEDTPFEPGRDPDFNGNTGTLTAENVQDAIEEVFNTAPGTSSRYAAICGFQGSTDDQWMEFFRDISSDVVPFVIAEDGTIKAFSLAVKNYNDNDDIPFDVYINGSLVYTFTLTYPNLTQSVKNLNIAVVEGDKLSVKARKKGGPVGAADWPVFTTFVQVTS